MPAPTVAAAHPGFTGTVSESTFINNSAQEGGAIFVNAEFPNNPDTITATVTSSFFQNNSASVAGGAVYVQILNEGILGTYYGNLAMNDCTISTCTAPDGAAIYNVGVAALVNCTLDGNNSSTSGAGSLETEFDADSPISLTNSILKTGSTGANVANSGITSHGHNISTDNAAGLLTATADMPNTDPMFVTDTPQNYGGPTETIAIGLFDHSPAINAGDDSVAPHRDQRGCFRTGHSDIGAYEYSGGLTGSSSIARSGNDAIISAEVVYGYSYQLERKSNLTDANWIPDRQRVPRHRQRHRIRHRLRRHLPRSRLLPHPVHELICRAPALDHDQSRFAH